MVDSREGAEALGEVADGDGEVRGRSNDQSDVDLLVDFDTTDHETWDYVTNYFDFHDALERLFGRKVDLVVGKGLRNKYFIANVNRTKQTIYG